MKHTAGCKLLAMPILLCLILPAGCGTKPATSSETTSKPAPAPPPPPPETSLGRLVKMERADKAPLSVICQEGQGRAFLGIVSGSAAAKKGGDMFRTQAIGGGKHVYLADPGIEVMNSQLEKMGLGLCGREGAARPQKTFVILSFEGKRSRGVNEAGELSDYMNFQAVSASNYLARVEGQSWLVNEGGKKYAKPGVVAGKDKTQLSFEVPTDSKALVWHDGKKKSYELEPRPKEISEPAAATGAPANGKAKP